MKTLIQFGGLYKNLYPEIYLGPVDPLSDEFQINLSGTYQEVDQPVLNKIMGGPRDQIIHFYFSPV